MVKDAITKDILGTGRMQDAEILDFTQMHDLTS